MTLEKLERAKELQAIIKNRYDQLRLIPKTKDYIDKTKSISISAINIVIPKTLEDMIFVLIEAEYKKEIEECEKEFKAL